MAKQRRFDLSGTWKLEETEGIDGFLIDAGMGARPPSSTTRAVCLQPLERSLLALFEAPRAVASSPAALRAAGNKGRDGPRVERAQPPRPLSGATAPARKALARRAQRLEAAAWIAFGGG
eukprot:COSAG06_NODE_43_length_29826_cov_32.009621_11_plen_120_part_00